MSLCLTMYHAMKRYWDGGRAPRILELGTSRRWIVSFMFRPLYPRYPLDRRLGRPRSRSGRSGEEKNSKPLPGIEPLNPDNPSRSQSLYRMSWNIFRVYIAKYETKSIRLLCTVSILRDLCGPKLSSPKKINVDIPYRKPSKRNTILGQTDIQILEWTPRNEAF
jgi:hypothetical protein